MLKKEEFWFRSAYSDTQIFAVRYVPEGEIKAILQISHGMVEHIQRYEDFAKYLNERGILVTGNDHLGHGNSVKSQEYWGYFSDKDGNDEMIENLHQVTKITKEKYPNIPYFLLGHSMGSFYARQYLCKYGNELDGAIIMGTGFPSKFTVKSGIFMTSLIAKFTGWKHRSKFIDNMAFGGYNKRFEPARTSKDWLSKDEKQVDKYLSDPRCTFLFTLNGYNNMFKGINNLHKKDFLEQMPKNLPVFFVSGADDPVGEFTESVKRAIESFKQVGMKNIELKFYKNDRHEILNETDKLFVYDDIYRWISMILSSEFI